jgi:putative heme-binding domain-containing protein
MRNHLNYHGLAALLLACSLATATSAEEAKNKVVANAEETNPFDTKSDRALGKVWLRAWCSGCHGRDGAGGRGPALTRKSFSRGDTDKEVFDNIYNGIPGTSMPGLPGIEEQSVWQIVAHIRSVRVEEERLPDGDETKGEVLFKLHKCDACHWTGSDGGRRGPNLTTSAAPYEFVRESLLDPDARVRPEHKFEHEVYQRLAVITAEGQVLEGRWMNENSSFLLFMDENEKLFAMDREEIDEVLKPRQSLMTSYRDQLNDTELEDLITYVFALRENTKNEE